MKKKTRYYINVLQATGRKPAINLILLLWLLFDRFKISYIGWCIFYTISGVLILLYVYDFFTVKEIDVDIQELLKMTDEKNKNEERRTN